MKVIARLLAMLATGGACISHPGVTADRALPLRPAVNLILGAFERHPLVAVGEGAGHGQLENRDFFSALIRDGRFPRTVRNIVIEFGNARYQDVADRYVSGSPVTRDELRPVWENTTQASGVWSSPMYEEMLAEVRAVNAGLPPAQRLRVLLGDPPIDWSAVISPADEDMNDWRDAHFAHVVDREVMRRDERALILIGGAHISRRVVLPNSLIHLLDARFPGRTFVVGVVDPRRLDSSISTQLRGTAPPVGVPVAGTWLGKADVRQIGFDLSDGVVQDDVDALVLLSHGAPRSSGPASLNPVYEAELARRWALSRATLPFRGAKIRFEENRAAFSPGADEPLEAVLKELLRDRDLRVLVKAFADRAESGVAVLTARRAELIAEWLVSRGVERDRLTPRGCGAARPLDFGKTAGGRAMNRRAELVRIAPAAGCEPPW